MNQKKGEIMVTMTSRNGSGSWLRAGSLALIVVLATLVAMPRIAGAADDETKTTYTRIELWQVERSMWDEFVELFEANDQKILQKMMADGAITEWGIDSMLIHTPDGYTHSVWYSAESMGALVKAGEAYDAAWKAMSKESMNALDDDFAAMITKHRDYVIDTDNLRSAAGTYDGGYYESHFVLVDREHHRGFHSYYENRIKPVFESLFEKGSVVAYGLSTEAVTTDNPAGHSWWYIVPDADGLDAVKAAFDADWDALDDEGRRERWAGIMETIEPGSYREEMTSIIHWSVKAH
jgi:hypothetical protein